MFEQIEVWQAGFVILGAVLLLHATLIMASLRYYISYNKLFIGRVTEKEMKELRSEWDKDRYSNVQRVIFGGVFLIVLGLTPDVVGVTGAVLVIGGSFALYGTILLFIWWRKGRSK